MPARLASLLLALALCAAPSVAEDVWTDVERIVAMGDIEGDWDKLISVLRAAEVIDADLNWTGGKTHLVQTGDRVDRGKYSRKIMDLFRRLEKDAKRAGGYVHSLIGNHEAMNVYGDLRYTSKEEIEAFRDKDSEKARERFLRQEIERTGGRCDEPCRKQLEAKFPLGYAEHRQALGPDGEYGRWITEQNAAVKINDTLFVHGGIGPKFATEKLRRMNDRVRAELRDFSRLQGGISMDPEGPLWYRGLAREDERALSGHVDKLLKNFGVRRIVIGHTPTDGAVLPRFAGQVVIVDVGLPEHYGGRLACLVVEGEHAYAIHRGVKLDIPTDPGAGLVEYLRRCARVDPQPSPLMSLIRRLEGRAGVMVRD